MGIPLNIICYGRGDNGVPSTAAPLPDLKERIDSYQHSISDHYGFEACTVSLHVSLAEAIDWLQNGLMRSLIVTGPDAEICWEGFLETITVTVGQKKASLSLTNMANYVRILWTFAGATGNGSPGDTPIVPTPGSAAEANMNLSRSLYGRKDYVGALPKVYKAVVDNAGLKILNRLCFPRSAVETSAMTGALGEITLELSFAGWYATTEWTIVSNSSAVNTATDAQLKTIYLPGLIATNPFLSTDYSGITYSGPLMPERVSPIQTYKQVFDRLLKVGDASNNAIAYGVYENRTFQAATSAEATPTTISYQEDAGTGVILDTYGNEVKPWNVRPNAMSQIVQLLDVAPVNGAIDAAARKYVSRTTCSIQGDSIGCTLEPGGAGGFEALVAAFPAYFEIN